MKQTVFDYIKENEIGFQKGIQLEEGWIWSMKEHLRKSFLYKNFQFTEDNEDRRLRPNKNIILPILNVQYRTEGFDVKDIDLYVDDPDEYYKSFLVNKYHNKWAPEVGMDTFIDDLVECYIDYGGVLVRKVEGTRPEVIDLKSIAFCNQRNLLVNPFCIKHTLSQSELRDMPGWGETSNGANCSIEELLILCKDEKEIEVYELHGTLPSEWLGGENDKKDLPQIQIIAYYKDQNNEEQGVTLFKKRMPVLPFKFLSRDKIINRALGRGGIEELFDTQIWTNWNEIKITEMLEAASKMVLLTDDKTLSAKHPSGLKDVDNLEILDVTEGKKGVWQIDNTPRNLAVFNDAVNRWEEQARAIGSANDAIMGEAPTAGTPFKSYEAQIIENKGMHKYRQGKLAVFMDEIYRDWNIPLIAKEIAKDNTFLMDLSADELLKISETTKVNVANEIIKEKILNGESIQPGEMEQTQEKIKNDFLKDGNKRFAKIIKGEFSKKLGVMTNIAGKQKNLAMMTDKLVNVMKQFIATPQIRQDPEMVKLLNVILESSGMSPISFGASIQTPPPMPPQGQGMAPQQLNQVMA